MSYLIIFILLVTKWLAGCALVVGMDMNFWQSVLAAWAGGMLGVGLYTYLGHLVFAFWSGPARTSRQEKVRFNRMKRIIVRVRRSGGLLGIAMLTPVLLTVPIGTVSANLIEPRKTRVMGYMGLSMAFWSVTFCGVDAQFGIDWVESLKSLFD